MRVMKSNSLSTLDVARLMGKSINEMTLRNIISRMNFIERLMLKHDNPVKIGDYKFDAWKGKLPFYLFRCSEHGYVVNYPIGYLVSLVCPLCFNKGKQPSDQLLDREIGVQEQLFDVLKNDS